MMDGLRIIDRDTDAIEDEDGTWYLMQQKHVEPYDRRVSKACYGNANEATWAYRAGRVQWEAWS